METINLTDKRSFTLKDPKTKNKVKFVGTKSAAREDYLAWNENNQNRTIDKDFYWWCSIHLAIIES